jgi:hypothetical protein
MKGFGSRLVFSYEYEKHVRWVLEQQGWTADPFGQALLSEDMQCHLRRTPTAARWLPDIIAAHGDIVIYVDAKASYAHQTGNHAVESASTSALDLWQTFTGCCVFYAFPHHDRDTFVSLADWQTHKRAGNYRGSGSGTPFDLARCTDICVPLPAHHKGEQRDVVQSR